MKNISNNLSDNEVKIWSKLKSSHNKKKFIADDLIYLEKDRFGNVKKEYKPYEIALGDFDVFLQKHNIQVNIDSMRHIANNFSNKVKGNHFSIIGFEIYYCKFSYSDLGNSLKEDLNDANNYTDKAKYIITKFKNKNFIYTLNRSFENVQHELMYLLNPEFF